MTIRRHIEARTFWGHINSFGFITDVSDKHICIKTNICLPLNSKIQLFIPSNKETLNVSGEVGDYSRTESRYNTLRVKVLNPPREYFAYIGTFSHPLSLSSNNFMSKFTSLLFTNNNQ
jgi:hypothetical protein